MSRHQLFINVPDTGSLANLYHFGILASIGVAGTWVPLLSTIARWFVFRRGLMCGITAAGIGVGVMVMPPLSSYFISNIRLAHLLYHNRHNRTGTDYYQRTDVKT